MLTVQEVKNYLRIEHDADDGDLESLFIPSAVAYLRNAVGELYDLKALDPRFKETARLYLLMLLSEMYENRSLKDLDRLGVSYISKSLLLQMQTGKYGVYWDEQSGTYATTHPLI